MNIFVLDKNPIKAARYQCDKHVVKMILESAQLLCTAHHEHPRNPFPAKFYKPTHKNHPCARWVRRSFGNYTWLCLHALYLCDEYTYRYGKVHASKPIIDWCTCNIPDIPICSTGDFVLAMPEEYKTDDAVESYRNYYIKDKKKTCSIE